MTRLELAQKPLLDLPAMVERVMKDLAKLPRDRRIIFYGANTCWWTHRSEDLHLLLHLKSGRIVYGPRKREYAHDVARAHGVHALPCDPRGGVLMEAHDIPRFFTNAAEHAAHYGKHTTRAFCAAHFDNARAQVPPTKFLLERLGLSTQDVLSATPYFTVPWCDDKWQAYNDAIDAWENR